ncbi:unnamed protein product [Hermetia illucens]|uniref:Uncharacterized protein n=1 Tax=Hermetia illucens TaxID=343691 RepID=A0A7R8UV17_HERIL|nr:unnamed protein product [Hermetia illucens]
MAENNTGILTPRRALFDLPSDNTSPAIRRLSLNSSLTWQNEEIIRQRGRRSFDLRPAPQENRRTSCRNPFPDETEKRGSFVLKPLSQESGQNGRISCRNPFPDDMEEQSNIEQGGCTIVINGEENTFSPFLDKARSINRRQSRNLCLHETEITVGPGKPTGFNRDEGRLGTPVSDKRRSFNKRQSLRRL